MTATRLLVCAVLVGLTAGNVAMGDAPAPSNDALRQKLVKTMNDGNYKDAYEGLRKLALDPKENPREVGNDLTQAVQCLQNLNRVHEIDALLAEVVAAQKTNWRLLWSAAQNTMNIPHHGFIVAGEFWRGNKRGGGVVVNAVERDRVRALQWMTQAMPLALKDENHAEVGDFLMAAAEMLLNNRGFSEAWRLQSLTNLAELPDYDPGWGYYRQSAGAPVDAEGKPVYYQAPKTFEAAKNDGERWRWCLQQTVEFNPGRLNGVRKHFADFLLSQFGVQTMARYGWAFGRMQTDDTKENESGTYALHTLSENETIAQLATGIKRFSLPDEFNYIKIYQKIAEEPQTGLADAALMQLAEIFENRRQYPKAADYWRRVAKEFPNWTAEANRRLDQIVGAWGRFEPVMTQPAGRGASVEFRFRNGHLLELTAHEIKVDKLLADVKEYLKGGYKKEQNSYVNHQKIDIGNIGYRLVQENEKQYLGDQVAAWTMVVSPRTDHFDKRVTVATPLAKPGAYLLRAKMKDGNTSNIVIWLADTAIAKKPLEGKAWYFVADAVTGKPVPKANVEFFGWQMQYHDKPQRHEVITKQFAEFTDADGQVIPDPSQLSQNFSWLAIARTDDGRFAYLGFSGIWYGRYHDAEYKATKVYAITDRPVYRPEQKVQYKFWVRHAQYDQEDTSDFAGKTFTIEIRNPKGEKIVEKQMTADDFGGMAAELALPADATLGVYQMIVRGDDAWFPGRNRQLGGGHFRVEEYKKPEFEVTVDAPKEPVMLGEKIEATINAKYYFGSPVANAKVKYKVTRTAHTERWYPIGPWDWLYGPGYWWFAYDYEWYPGWKHWGCQRPMPLWWQRGHQPPELVAEQEVEIGEDGTVKVQIDTGLAKALHPDQDHSYSITAEVTDQSRRTIVGAGDVLVARKPFTVYAWVDRGYFRVGDTIRASFNAHTLDHKPVEGKGKLTLLKISYDKGKPVETPVQNWDLDTNAEGVAFEQIKAAQAGQYRLAYKLTSRGRPPLPLGEGRGEGGGTAARDAADPHPNPLPKGEGTHTIEGGYLFTIIGEGFDGSQFKFNNIELIPDKADYAPGEKVKLQINTDRAGSTVMLFLRPTNGVYLPPKVLRLEGKSTVEEIEVVKKDMPNFFVEALTVADGKVHTDSKEIVVPPEKRVLAVDIEPSKEAYKPGEKAKVKLKLTDFFGKPFVGSTVVAIYDKSVEYISGGSNVPEIKEFFWKWRRHHRPGTESSLARWFHNVTLRDAAPMQNLGVFGATVADEMEGLAKDKADVEGEARGRGGMAGGGVAFGARRASVAEAANGAPMAPAAAAPAPGAPMEKAGAAMDAMAEAGQMERKKQAGPGEPPAMVEPTVRKAFADTALWVAALTTDKDGTAQVELDMPENLTTWRIKVWGMGGGTKVGQGQVDVVTRKDLIVRMQSPRFFTQTDEVVLSANVHNYLKTAKRVEAVLELKGKTLEPVLDVKTSAAGYLRRSVEVAANGEARIDWRVKVLDEGEAVVTMKALTDEESDAMEMKFPCYIHGMLKTESYSGAIRPKDPSGKFAVTVPEKRQPDQTRLEVRYSPTLAGAMVDALPYVVDYPYGCTEQTLNRFLPTVITQKVLIDMGLDLAEIEKKQTNLNAQEIGVDADRAKQWKRYDRNPVFNQDEVRKMVREGVERLTEMQLSDGGWGWFSGFGEHSFPHTTALVVHGLQLAQRNDVAIVPGTLARGVEWLKRYQDEQVQLLKNFAEKDKHKQWKQYADNVDAFVYMVLVDAGVVNADMREFLYRDRTQLSVYAMAMYGIALEKQGERAKLDMILRNISQFVVEDNENQTAWLNLPGGFWWYWYGSEYEAHAYYLKLLSKTDPKGELAPRLVKYLLNNRKHATYWNSTRDTAVCIEAMADFLRASGEDKPEMTVEVYLDGKLQKAVEITPKTLFLFDNKFVAGGEAMAAGKHEVELKRKGTGPLYYNGYMTNFTLEDFITKAGLEIKVERKYYKLNRVDKKVQVAGSRGQVVDQKVEKYERQELPNLSALKSGDLCEVELVIESKNDYEYIVFEDLKPAGFEPVEIRSGYNGNDLGAYVEFRDRSVNFFARALARGKHSVAYRMRAEIPGQFSALPTRAWAMYAPELKANSDEIKLKVSD